jgi:acyl-CoA synthetase (AMP-forming)/AMP-acid ligase II
MFPHLKDRLRAQAARMPDGALSYGELERASAALALRLPRRPLALWAEPRVATVVSLTAALRAGVPLVPINPRSGERELAHVLADADPCAVLAASDVSLPGALARLPRIDPRGAADALAGPSAELPADTPALIIYTSGTTGSPKGVVESRGALIANLDALADVWGLRREDTIVHALPLFHVHGLVLGTIGPLRLGARVRHLGTFDARSFALALEESSVMYGVPTMYQRLLEAAAEDARVVEGLGRARLFVSGSAALAADVHVQIERLTGRRVVERYGMTETLIIASTRPREPARPGYVGVALPGVEVSVRDERGAEVRGDDEEIGGVWVRGPSVFAAYANPRDSTEDAFADGWFDTGDLAALTPAGELRLVGRRSSDLIKSGGYRIAAGEIEAALREHPAVREVAVRGLPDSDLGERVAAWVVVAEGANVADGELVEHVARELTPHKRPREIHRVHSLPRNELGKVQKQLLEP